jgi:hypothetical protein
MRKVLYLFVLMSLLVPSVIFAEQGEITFVLQEVVEVFDTAGDAHANRIQELGITSGGMPTEASLNFPGEDGDRDGTFYTQRTGSVSHNDKSESYTKYYKVRQKTISTPQEFLDFYGKTGTWELSNHQLALYQAFFYMYRPDDHMQMRMGMREDDLTIKLIDTSQIDCYYDSDVDPSDEILHAKINRDAFWPSANSSRIRLSSFNYAYKPVDNIKSTMLHEFCHAIDDRRKESGSYGPDGSHTLDELTTGRAAFKEAWAQFNEKYEFPAVNEDIPPTGTVYREGATVADPHNTHYLSPATDLSYKGFFECEGIIAGILYDISQIGDVDNHEGFNKIYEIFEETNKRESNRKLKKEKNFFIEFLEEYLKEYPDDIAQVLHIIDQATYNSMSDDAFEELVGRRKAQVYFDWRDTQEAEAAKRRYWEDFQKRYNVTPPSVTVPSPGEDEI